MGACERISGGEQCHVPPAGNEAFSDVASHGFPSAILPGRRAPRDRRQDRDPLIVPDAGIEQFFLLHGSEQVVERDRRKSGGRVGKAVRDDQFTIVNQTATGVHDVGHVALAFAPTRLE